MTEVRNDSLFQRGYGPVVLSFCKVVKNPNNPYKPTN